MVSGGYDGPPLDGVSKVEVYDVRENSWEEGRRNKRDKCFIAGSEHFTTVLPGDCDNGYCDKLLVTVLRTIQDPK